LGAEPISFARLHIGWLFRLAGEDFTAQTPRAAERRAGRERHHSIRPEHRNKNFAVWFPFYDVMFGTAWRPRPGEYPESGVEGIEVSNMSDAFMLPFARWWDMAKSKISS
jgi:hypothetical protein